MRVEYQRIGCGLSALGSLAWLLWPTGDWVFEPEAALAFAVTILTWLARELVGNTEEAVAHSRKTDDPNENRWEARSHPNDVRISKAFLELFSNSIQHFLKDQDFGRAFGSDLQRALTHAADSWVGPRWEYEDEELSVSFTSFKSILDKFCQKLVKHFEPVEYGVFTRLAVPPQERATAFSVETRRLINEMSDLASSLYQAGEQHTRVIRRRLPEAFSE